MKWFINKQIEKFNDFLDEGLNESGLPNIKKQLFKIDKNKEIDPEQEKYIGSLIRKHLYDSKEIKQ